MSVPPMKSINSLTIAGCIAILGMTSAFQLLVRRPEVAAKRIVNGFLVIASVFGSIAFAGRAVPFLMPWQVYIVIFHSYLLFLRLVGIFIAYSVVTAYIKIVWGYAFPETRWFAGIAVAFSILTALVTVVVVIATDEARYTSIAVLATIFIAFCGGGLCLLYIWNICLHLGKRIRTLLSECKGVSRQTSAYPISVEVTKKMSITKVEEVKVERGSTTNTASMCNMQIVDGTQKLYNRLSCLRSALGLLMLITAAALVMIVKNMATDNVWKESVSYSGYFASNDIELAQEIMYFVRVGLQAFYIAYAWSKPSSACIRK